MSNEKNNSLRDIGDNDYKSIQNKNNEFQG